MIDIPRIYDKNGIRVVRDESGERAPAYVCVRIDDTRDTCFSGPGALQSALALAGERDRG